MKIDVEKTISEPLLNNSKQNGGFRALLFIMVSESFQILASYGVLPNMILYLTREYRLESSTGANIIFLWSAATYFTPIIGAFLADSLTGRYPMIGFGSIASLLGLALLWLTTMIPEARPPPCDQFRGRCESATSSQLLVLYFCFCIVSVGSGGVRSSSLAFGADQLMKKENTRSPRILETYISWYTVSASASVTISVTIIVYIQENMGWKVGFGVPVVLMFLSALLLFSASCLYVKSKDKTTLITGFARILVAFYRNRHIQLSSLGDEMYHCGRESLLMAPSEKLRFLNKACVIRNPEQDLTTDGRASDPWSLCTVDQVEELKALIKVLPIWCAGAIKSVNSSQGSFLVLQAASMDRHITSNFEIPAGSYSVFLLLSLVATVALYDRIIIPLASRIKGRPVRLDLKQKMGIGLVLSCLSMAAIATVEYFRREITIQEGFSETKQAVARMSALWLVPHYVLAGMAEAFFANGQIEFYYSELSKSMSTISSNLYGLGLGVASLMSSLIVNIVDKSTTTGREESWVSSNINRGRYDYYYWLLFVLSFVNFIYYVGCSKAYGPCKVGINHKNLDAVDGMRDQAPLSSSGSS